MCETVAQGGLSCTLWALSDANLLSRNPSSQNICCTGESVAIKNNNENMFTEKGIRIALLKSMAI